jgi:peptide/nickel transport system substrate-binding protein
MLLPRRAVQGIVQAIQQQWQGGEEGTLSILPGYSWAFLAPQFSGPQPEDLLDVRVREALLLSLDRAAIAEAVVGDRALASDLWISAASARYAAITTDLARHLYDPARARDLFHDAGWRRTSADDVLIKQGRRFELELTTTPEWERASAAVAEYWREAGVDVRMTVLSRSAMGDRLGRATYQGVELMGGPPSLALVDGHLNAANVPTQENQFVGANRGHYTSPELDELLDRYWTTLDQQQRDGIERRIAQHIATDLPMLGLFFYPAMAAVRRTVREVRLPQLAGPAVGQATASWNAHEWRTE